MRNGPMLPCPRRTLAKMMMGSVSPTNASVGVPVSSPVVVLNSAQAGLPAISNSGVSVDASTSVGL